MNVYHKRPEADPEIVRIRKERQCLLCLVPFESEWSGERICQKCKSRSIWREGHS
jgi:5-methylcytosine-specific restriction endonuclease McrA